MIDVIRKSKEYEINKPEFRKELAGKLKNVINQNLEKHENFGGIEEVMFTSFLVK